MSDQVVESEDNAPKRMRLGTRSCAECRRRKVRCVFPPGSAVCEGCTVHGVSCKRQQPSRGDKKRLRRSGDAKLQRRVKELEDTVRQICGAIDLGMDSSVPIIPKTRTAEALSRPPHTSSAATSSLEENQLPSEINYTPSASENVSTLPDDSDEMDVFEDAPFINFFQDAMVVQRHGERQSKRLLCLLGDARMQDAMRSLRTLMPEPDALESILEATARYWSIWPPCHLGPDFSDQLETGGGGTCPVTLLSNALTSRRPGLMAKAVVFLALCILQLPKQLQRQKFNMPVYSQLLIQSYIRVAKNLLSISADIGETVDDLEYWILEWKLYVNLGKPRKAWLSCRHAMNTALLFGLHRLEDGGDEIKRRLWDHVWQVERHMSMVLGFPCAISNSHPAVVGDDGVQGVQRLIRQMCLISGAVIERDQKCRTVDYSVTVKMQEDLEQLRAIMPDYWWDPIPSPSLPLDELYHRQTIKIQYFSLCKIVHLPYMLKSTTSKKFEHSREVTLDASRELIKNYQGIRHSTQGEFIFCELMEFGAFCAAVVIMIDLFAQPSRRTSNVALEDERLVDNLTLTLRRVSQVMECTIAAQGAQLLEFLGSAYRGTYNGPRKYTAVIPYFGRVQIICPIAVGSRAESVDSSTNTKSPVSNTVEFSAHTFSHSLPTDSSFEAELGCDWSALLDLDATYDWFQTFDCNATSC